MNYGIIGNGIAGVRAAEAIRELDRGGRLIDSAAHCKQALGPESQFPRICAVNN